VNQFEGSFLGDGNRIGDNALMECGVCWWVYDPARGDEVWHIPPKTPFAQLPSHWRCPNCDAAASQFMTLRAGEETAQGDAASPSRPPRPAGLDTLAALSRKLEAGYQRAAVAMQALPVYNPALRVEVVGMRRCEAGYVAVAATPWSMNLVLLCDEAAGRREGSSREVAFPSGMYPFLKGYLEGVGPLETCSLFSPMQEFEDQAAVTAVALAAIDGLFEAETGPAPSAPSTSIEPPTLSRRQFLRPGATG
jgi:[NiFe] hydrogenase assembly HybE family chaperone